uniref:Uncharacterized protein n=1 Tax=Drosophila melanogaster TaxID=7227 RepID=Q9VX19_DROME|nr:uncharacterized protein Dmel_CG12986 [Drosophila melanogaster]AAF48764.1 uncharacterized protein Dmel_CG12986 [Drosophila melanogaster]|eukprot:NP_573243.1 uncharacterized protein Dmel_CG12986 [Drosophila melanogaster]
MTGGAKMMTILCVSIFIAGNALGASISTSAVGLKGRPQRIAECRELCYRQSLPAITPPLLCRSRPDCYMCHDYCRVLDVVQRSLATSMCADREFCTRGCRVACSYHRLRIFHFTQDATANAVIKK